MLEKKTAKGVIKYRMPDIVEGYDFLALMEGKADQSSLFKMKARFIRAIGSMIDLCGIYPTYEDALKDKDNMMQPLGEIADEVLTDITKALAKKD
jgi:hypothetical protein